MKKKVKITVDAAVFEYSSKIWKVLAGIEPSMVTLRLSKGQGVPNKECSAIISLLDKLIVAIQDFKPMTLTSVEDDIFYRRQLDLWHRHLLALKKKLKKQCKPVYLVDIVNTILKESNCKLHCTNLILAKCFYILGIEKFSADNVAAIIMNYGRTNWEKLPVQLNYVKKTLVIYHDKASTKEANEPVSKDKRRHKRPTLAEQAEKLYLFPYSCPSTVDNTDLRNDIMDDLSIIDEYTRWTKESALYELNSDYKATYEQFRSRLHTLPPKKNEKRDEGGTVNMTLSENVLSPLEVALGKHERMEELSEADQLAMLRDGRCPRCGGAIAETTNRSGIPYLRCNACYYFAGIEDGEPYVNTKYITGVAPQHNT